MSITNKDRRLLTDVLVSMRKAEKYIKREDILVCHTERNPYPYSFINKEGQGISPMNKEIGSDIAYLYKAIRTLDNLLNPEIEEE